MLILRIIGIVNTITKVSKFNESQHQKFIQGQN